ncbi:hypothetical protein DHEL01_v202190 [Diaporthe helianthi]|uniref:Uncharacterized protein n=1 Tax=Diaporthe helianthi TaxID=158607 RepID=A0A2P5IAA8_DIAHE|nr:hypothetical protein DHEL01_v202190 [Diaporthe helianthi]
MPAFDDAIRGRGKGGGTPNHGRHPNIKQSPQTKRKASPFKTPSPVTDLHHRRVKRKRSQDRLASDKTSKKVRRDGQFRPGHGSADAIDLTGDDGPVKSSASPLIKSENDSAGIIRDTTHVDLTDDSSVNGVDTSLCGAGPAPNDDKPPIPPTPTRGAKEEAECITLTDSDDESEKTATAVSSTPVRKTAQPGAVENISGLMTPSTPKTPSSPKTPRPIAQPRRRLGAKDGKARQLDSFPEQGATQPTPAHDRIRLMSEMPFQPDGLTAGSPGASRDLESPFKASPAREATKKTALARTPLPVARKREAVREQEADQDQLPPGGSESASQLVARSRGAGTQETDDKTNKNPCTVFIVVFRAPPQELLRISRRGVHLRPQRPDIPIDDKCFLVPLVVELKHIIFENLLLSADPIQLLNQWSERKRGSASGLHPAILLTCKAMYESGCKFLYGENEFQYLVRDKHRRDATRSLNRRIYFEKYMQRFMKLELSIERSRTEHAYYTSVVNALNLLIQHGANLHTLTICVSPTVEGDTLSTKNKYVQGEMKPPSDQLNDMCDHITRACENPLKVVEEGLFEFFKVKPRRDGRFSARKYQFLDGGIDSQNDDDRDSDYEE